MEKDFEKNSEFVEDLDKELGLNYDDYQDSETEDETEIEESDGEDEEYTQHLIQNLDDIIINDSERISSHKLSQAEFTELIGQRAQQICKTGITFIEGNITETDAVEIAKKELLQRRCPLKLRRPVGYYKGSNYYEDWDPNDMVLPF